MKLNEEVQVTLMHKALREEQQAKIQYNKQAYAQKIRSDVSAVKEEKRMQKDIKQYQENQHEAKARTIKTLIRQQQEEAKSNKNRVLAEKKMMAREQMTDKMARDEAARIDHERSVAKMEQEELELIQRLKDTQAMQQAAFQQLEEALNTGIPMAG